ncbi:MAG: hypothetical protein AABY33_07580 [Pseudomonadota bacterium]
MVAKPHKPIINNNGNSGIDADSILPPKATAPKPGFFKQAAETVSNNFNRLINFIGFAPMFAPLVVGGAKVVGKIGDSKIGKSVGLGRLANVGTSTESFLDKSISEVFGGSNSNTIRGFQNFADSAGNVVNTASDKLGVSYIAKISDSRATSRLAKLAKLGKEASERGIPGELTEHAKKFIGSIGNIDHQEISKTFSEAIANTKDLSRKDSKLLNKILYTAEKANNSRVNAGYWRKPGNLLKNLSGAIGKAKVLPGIANITFIGLSVASLVGVVGNFIKNVSALKSMSKDITGKETSTLDIIRGKVPDIVKDSRSKLLKSSVVSGATDAISLGLNVASAVKGNVSMLGYMAPQFAGMGLNAMIGESSLSIYTALSQAHASGQKISGEAYAALIGTASPELKKRGGADSIFAKELGKIYAEENASPAQVMRRAVNGELMKDLNALIAANEAAKATATVAAPAAVATGSHVAALQKTANKADIEQKPVVGNHTAQLVANAGQANDALKSVGA